MSEYLLAELPRNERLDPWIRLMLSQHLIARRHVMKKLRPPMSWLLYKYLPAGRPHSLTNLRDLLVRSLLRLSSPSKFNDPFELAAHFSLESTERQRLARFEKMARELEPHRGWRAIQAQMRSLMAATTSAEVRPALVRSLNGVRDAAGIYSFAGDARNTLMWSHYASDHKGICLIFDRAQDVATFSHAFHVSYARKLPVLNWIRSFHKDIGKMLFSKHPAWRYEKESRIMINYQAERYLPFAPQALYGMIFGCRAESPFVNDVNQILAERVLAGHPPVRVYHAQMHPRKYRLVIKNSRR